MGVRIVFVGIGDGDENCGVAGVYLVEKLPLMVPVPA
jgi:hypothetical protein